MSHTRAKALPSVPVAPVIARGRMDFEFSIVDFRLAVTSRSELFGQGVLVAIVQNLTLRLKALLDKAYSFKNSLGLPSSKIEPSSAYVASQCH